MRKIREHISQCFTSVKNLIKKSGKYIIAKWKVLVEIDEAKPFYRHTLFYLFISPPLLLSVFSAYHLSSYVTISDSFDKDSFDFFMSHFKFAYTSAGVSILTGVFFSRMHASKQRAKALMQVDVNNNFKNYTDHKKEFIQTMTKIQGKAKLEMLTNPKGQTFDYHLAIDSTEFYRFLFPQNNPTHFLASLSSSAIQEVRSIMHTFKSKIDFSNPNPLNALVRRFLSDFPAVKSCNITGSNLNSLNTNNVNKTKNNYVVLIEILEREILDHLQDYFVGDIHTAYLRLEP